ncbi:MAG: hypothetical protein SFU25_10000 [Candidatus Caenarcaniphilales bacterium]|nr:hypothetical protein [Candidatus Caenarcaniphilales bacterium]
MRIAVGRGLPERKIQIRRPVRHHEGLSEEPVKPQGKFLGNKPQKQENLDQDNLNRQLRVVNEQVIRPEDPEYEEMRELMLRQGKQLEQSQKSNSKILDTDELINRGKKANLSDYQSPARQSVHQAVMTEIDDFVESLPKGLAQEAVLEQVNERFSDIKIVLATPEQINTISQGKALAFFKEPVPNNESRHLDYLLEQLPNKEEILRIYNSSLEPTKAALEELGVSEEDLAEKGIMFIKRSESWNLINDTHELAHAIYHQKGIQARPDMRQFHTFDDFVEHISLQNLASTGQAARLTNAQRLQIFPQSLAEAEVNQVLLTSENLRKRVNSFSLGMHQASYGSGWLRALPDPASAYKAGLHGGVYQDNPL